MQLRSSRISKMLQGVPEIVGPSKRQADVCCRTLRSLACEELAYTFRARLRRWELHTCC